MERQEFSGKFEEMTYGSHAYLPEYLRKEKLGSLLPHDPVIAPRTAVVADSRTGRLYINLGAELNSDTRSPRQYVGRSEVGVLRLFEEINSEVVDGYIVDARHLSPGDISISTMISPPSFSDSEPEEPNASRRNRKESLLAAVFTDPEGSVMYVGDIHLQEHMHGLMAYVDGLPQQYDALVGSQESKTPEGLHDSEPLANPEIEHKFR